MVPSVTQAAHRKSGKQFRDQLILATGERTKKGTRKLRLVANRMVRDAIRGNTTAQTAIRDTLDGKPAQAIEVDHQITITAIERRIVDPLMIDVTPDPVASITHDKSDT